MEGKQQEAKEEPILEIKAGDFVVTEKKCACYGKARDFLTLPNLRMLCMDEWFDEVEVRYVGGLWVLFEFNSEETCTNFMQSEAMDHWLREKKHWDRNFVSEDRLVWVDIEGLPIRAWSKTAVRQIVARWGTVAHLDDSLGEDLYKNRVCMLTGYQGIISEVIKVRVDGDIFSIRVKEAPGWIPSFARPKPHETFKENEDERFFDNDYHDGPNEDNREDKEESEDPFGIYETMAKLQQEELLNGVPRGFHDWKATKAPHHQPAHTQEPAQPLSPEIVQPNVAVGSPAATVPTVPKVGVFPADPEQSVSSPWTSTAGSKACSAPAFVGDSPAPNGCHSTASTSVFRP
ncbi:hypothetical protein LXL04_035245 [Taraxacum kok-saghyz]